MDNQKPINPALKVIFTLGAGLLFLVAAIPVILFFIAFTAGFVEAIDTSLANADTVISNPDTHLRRLAIEPNNVKLHFGYAASLEAKGDLCGAGLALQPVKQFRGEHAVLAQEVLREASFRDNCEPFLIDQTAKFEHTLLNGNIFQFDASISGEPLKLSFDTASYLTYITESQYKSMAISESSVEPMDVNTAWGIVPGNRLHVSELVFEGVSVRDVDVVVIADQLDGFEGAIGMNVLSRMQFSQLSVSEWQISPA